MRIRSEPRSPETIAQDDDAVLAGNRLFRREKPPEGRRHPQRRERLGRQRSAIHAFHIGAVRDREGLRRIRGEALDHPGRLAPRLEREIAQPGLANNRAAARMVLRQDDDAIGCCVGQRPQQHAVDDGEDGGVDADGEGEREKSGDREARRTHHQSHRVAEILDEHRHCCSSCPRRETIARHTLFRCLRCQEQTGEKRTEEKSNLITIHSV